MKPVLALAVALLFAAPATARAQASAIPSADPVADHSVDRGRVLLDDMVTALGGDAWRNRRDWRVVGKRGTFYKGKPTENVVQFEEYHRVEPFATRVVVISRYGIFIPTDHRDVVELFTPDAGFEITFKGSRPLPAADIRESVRRRQHSLETVVFKLLQDPATQVVYDGASEVNRRFADKVTVLTAGNDSIDIELDRTTHLPLSRTFQYRDAQFGDFDTDREEYDNYQPEQGVMTPLTVTRYRNGDMVAQRFTLSIKYNLALSPELFDPSRLLQKPK